MHNNTSHETFLHEECIKEFIKTAKEEFNPEGVCPPQLYVMFDSGEGIYTYLTNMPLDPDARYKRMCAFGLKLRSEYGSIREALYIAETWTTNAKVPGFNKIRPSQHPAREETIVIIGRNHDKSCSAVAIQPFSRDKKGAPIWKTPTISISREQGDLTFEGILDALFIDESQIDLPELEA